MFQFSKHWRTTFPYIIYVPLQSHTLESVLSGILFVLFVLLYFWYSNKPGNHVLLFPGFVLSKGQRKYEKSITFSITFSMLVETWSVLLVLFQALGFQLHALACHLLRLCANTDWQLLNAVMAEDNNSVYWCAAKELCICKTAAATTRHLCPVCEGSVHATCGKICEDASILYHTMCHTCFSHLQEDLRKHWEFSTFYCCKLAEDDLQSNTMTRKTSNLVHRHQMMKQGGWGCPRAAQHGLRKLHERS